MASEAIKQDIKSYAIYMDSGGQTGAEPALEPALRPRTADNPGGFDYEGLIHVLPGNTLTLAGGGTLEITADYQATEAPHMATVYNKALNALFLADFGYNKVHLWMGDDISRERIAAWRAELVRIRSEYAARNPKVYPGHGAPTDLTLMDDMIRYIDDFTRVTSQANSREEAMAQMTALYPDYGQARFLPEVQCRESCEIGPASPATPRSGAPFCERAPSRRSDSRRTVRVGLCGIGARRNAIPLRFVENPPTWPLTLKDST